MKGHLAGAVFLLGVLIVPQPSHAATCTITKYSADDIKAATKNCTEITLDGISVPPGVTLNLTLTRGTKLTFQNTITWGYYEWKGPLINITGTNVQIVGAKNHVLDARGNLWWDDLGEHGRVKPVFFVLHELKNSTVRNITIRNTPYHAIWIENSDGVVANDILVDSKAGDSQGGHNTDGINVWKSNNVTIRRLTVFNQDDCVAVKSGSNITVTDAYCDGSHGLSIGAVGGRDYNNVTNVNISNSEVVNSENGVSIITGYGVTGSVTNVTFQNITLKDINKYGIVIEGDYNINTGSTTGIATDGVPIKGLTLRNITGTVKKAGANIYVLVKKASNWHWSGINVTGGENKKICDGIPAGTGVSC